MDRHKNFWGKIAELRPGITLACIIFGGLMIGGCEWSDTLADLFRFDGNGKAEAQEDTKIRIETHTVSSNSFRIEVEEDSDQTPTVEILDGATRYVMNSNATVRFDPTGGSNDSFLLEPGDVIIERPGTSGTGSITIIRTD